MSKSKINRSSPSSPPFPIAIGSSSGVGFFWGVPPQTPVCITCPDFSEKPNSSEFRIIFIGISLLFLIGYSTNLLAQNKETHHAGHQIKFSLADVFDPATPAYLLSYELPIAKKYAFMAEGGLVSTFNGNWVQGNPIEGYKLRAEGRYYPLKLDNEKLHLYTGLQAMYKETDEKREEVFLRADDGYQQLLKFTENTNVLAFHVSCGIIFLLKKHIAIEGGVFTGLRLKDRKYLGIPPDADPTFDKQYDINESGEHTIPSFGISIKAGLRL